MTWTLENSKNDESSKIRWELVPYFRGKCLDIGSGPYKVFPHFTAVDNGHHWGANGIDIRVDTAENLDCLGSRSWDLAYSSHLLEHIPYEKVPATLREWCRVVKDGGHVILYLPDEDEYPKVGHEYANKDHKWDVNFDRVIEAMERVERGWDLVDFQRRNETDEYSLLFVFCLGGKGHRQSWQNPKPEKTAAVIRYGAFGDMAQTSSLFPALKEQGYHTTLYCQAGGYDVVKHDPYVDRFIVQEKDAVPNVFLHEFWEYTRKKYTKWINLCESIEGTLLAAPGRSTFEWPNKARAVHMDRNYLEWTHLLAGLPGPYRPKFYSTLDERAWARRQAKGERNVLWSLAGSSGHKVWPHLDTVIRAILEAYKDVHIYLVGDEVCRLLQNGWDRHNPETDKWVDVHPRVHCRSGIWSIRESMAFAEVADLIIGTETGLLNAAGSMDAWKIITLSHSSQNMLTKHWKNVIALEQPEEVGCEKRWKENGGACRQLHGGEGHSPWEACPQHEETGTALCQFHIGPERMFEAIQSVFGKPVRFSA